MYPFHPVQIVIRTNVVFCLPAVLDNVLPRERRLTSIMSEELPQFLALVV